MKTYKHLWEDFLSDENIRGAIINSAKGKLKRRDVTAVRNNIETYIPIIRQYASNFYNLHHRPKRINDGVQHKVRHILVPSYAEQIVHHMICQTMMPLFTKGMYFHTNASIPLRGGTRGQKYIEKWLKDKKNTKYYLKMDIRHFFDSIPHDILKSKLARYIRDEKFLNVVFTLIDVNQAGLPLGFYTSQWLANWYLQDLDHFIKEQLHAKYYMRYMDDMVIFGSNKRKLHKIRIAISEYLKELGLELKGNWAVVLFDNAKGNGRDLDYMGFRFFRNRTIMRKSIMIKASRKARRISNKEKVSIYECRQMLAYWGWMKNTDSYRFYNERIRPLVSISMLKKYVGKYDREKLKNVVQNTAFNKTKCYRLYF